VGSITVPKGKTTTFPEDVPTQMGYLLDTCLAAQDEYKALLKYFRVE